MAKKSLNKEIRRKLFHLLELPVLIVYTISRQVFSERIAILTLTIMFAVLLEIEYLRLEYRPKLPEFIDVFRRHERDNVTGTIFFISATIIVFAAFDYSIAMLALMLTVFGDFASALIGIKFGKHRIHKSKTREGFLAGLAVNVLIGYLFLPAFPLVFLSMALVASLVELLTGKLDDNLTVPLAAAFTGHMVVFFFQMKLPVFPGPVMDQVLKLFVH